MSTRAVNGVKYIEVLIRNRAPISVGIVKLRAHYHQSLYESAFLFNHKPFFTELIFKLVVKAHRSGHIGHSFFCREAMEQRIAHWLAVQEVWV